MFDIGVNLANSRFRNQVDHVVHAAKENGLGGIISISNSHGEWSQNLHFCATYSTPVFTMRTTIGIHPHHANEAMDNPELWKEMKELVKQPLVVAVGECGLDFDRMQSTREHQIEVFKKQIELAQAVNKPLYLHVRDGKTEKAMEPFITILTKAKRKYPHLRGIVHCFTAGSRELDTFLQLGFYFGITGWVCDERRNKFVKNALRSMPISLLMQCILFETDAPYLTPPKFAMTEKTNYPHAVLEIVEYVADLLEVDKSELIRASINNTRELFAM